MSAISQAVRKWKQEEITWEELVEVIRRLPKHERAVQEPAVTVHEQWRRAEEEAHTPGSWDDLYLEWLFGELTRPQFEALEVALLTQR